MKLNQSIELSDSTKSMTAGEMRRALEGVPDEATINVSTHKGDWHYSDWHTITISWSEER